MGRASDREDVATYRVLVGINYPDPKRKGAEKRAEPGDLVSDLPSKAADKLVSQGVLQEVTDRG